LVKEVPEKNLSAVTSSYYINDIMLCERNSDADNTAEGVVYSLDGEVETYLSCRLYITSKMTKGRENIFL
jgi:hypothetical protein